MNQAGGDRPARGRAAVGDAGEQQAAGIRRTVRVVDADGKILGRLASDIALALRGKDQSTWVPYRDAGAVVVVTNTDKVRVSGTKMKTKVYTRHTQRKPGAWRQHTLAQRLAKDSRQVVRAAVFGMLPKNRLRHRMITRLKLYQGAAP